MASVKVQAEHHLSLLNQDLVSLALGFAFSSTSANWLRDRAMGAHVFAFECAVADPVSSSGDIESCWLGREAEGTS
jgi:hypothetical protein